MQTKVYSWTPSTTLDRRLWQITTHAVIKRKKKCKEAFSQARASGKWCENKKKLSASCHGTALIREISKAQRVETGMKQYK